MKKIIITSLFLFSLIVVKAQYFGFSNSDKNFYSVALPYPADGNYRVMVYDLSFPATPTFVPCIKVYNQAHQLIQTKQLLKGISLFEEPPLKVGTKLLWPCSYWDTTSIINPQFQLSVLELDTLYNVINLHRFGKNTIYVYASGFNPQYSPSGLIRFNNGYIFGGIGLDTINNNIYAMSTLYKLNNNFIQVDSVDYTTKIYLGNGFIKGHHFFAKAENLNLTNICISGGNAFSFKVSIDTNLTVLNCKSLDVLTTYICKHNGGKYNNPINVESRDSKVVSLTPTKQLVLGNADVTCSYGPVNFNLESAIVNSIMNGNQIIKTNVFQITGKNVQYEDGWSSNIATKLPYFLTVGSVGFGRPYPILPPPFFPYFVEQKSKLFVNKSDTLGNIIWTKEYGGEMNYYGRGIAFTPDGGCIITGTRYDSISMFAQHISQNFILKLDSNGNYNSVGIFDNGQLRNNLVKCYPNPAKELLYVDMPFESDINLIIYNQLGQILLEEKNYQSMAAIDVKLLPSDLYYYKIITRQNTYSGKFVKE